MYGYGNSLYLTTRAILAKANSGTPPVNTVAPVISGTQVVGSTLSSTTGTWTGSPAPTYTYQWYRGAILISGATSSTYTLVQADAGNTSNINCQVTAINTAGSATATSNILAQILDFDANAFITSAAITDNTQKAATNTLTIDLKGYGIWTKMKALYPFVGGTASAHKFNLKNPLDTDAAFRIVFYGGWTHNSIGAKGNATNGFATTFLNSSTNLTNGNFHLSVYCNSLSTSPNYITEIGQWINFTASGWAYLRLNNKALGTAGFCGGNDNTESANSSSTTAGFAIGTETSNSLRKFIKNGTILATNTTSSTSALLNAPLTLGGNQLAGYNGCTYNFASIGDGLSDTEAANFYIAVQAFQTTLSRNV